MTHRIASSPAIPDISVGASLKRCSSAPVPYSPVGSGINTERSVGKTVRKTKAQMVTRMNALRSVISIICCEQMWTTRTTSASLKAQASENAGLGEYADDNTLNNVIQLTHL